MHHGSSYYFGKIRLEPNVFIFSSLVVRSYIVCNLDNVTSYNQAFIKFSQKLLLSTRFVRDNFKKSFNFFGGSWILFEPGQRVLPDCFLFHAHAYHLQPSIPSLTRSYTKIPTMTTQKMAKIADQLKVYLRSEKATTPTKGSALAAGYDLYASEDAVIPAQGQGLVATDISIIVPIGTYGRVAPRSGLAVKHGISTGAGVIDADYRGEVKIVLFNHSSKDFEIKSGDRIAQLVLEKIINADIVEITKEELDTTERGEGGFGSTGTN